jgi:hypothetical protein
MGQAAVAAVTTAGSSRDQPLASLRDPIALLGPIKLDSSGKTPAYGHHRKKLTGPRERSLRAFCLPRFGFAASSWRVERRRLAMTGRSDK